MKARYLTDDGLWILVKILESLESTYRVIPLEWKGVRIEEFYVPRSKIEFIISDRF